MASSDSRQAVTSPMPTAPITTRSSPAIEWTLYPNSSIRSRTWSISSLVACSFIEMIIACLLGSPKNQKTHSFEWVAIYNLLLQPTRRDSDGKVPPVTKSKRVNSHRHEKVVYHKV